MEDTVNSNYEDELKFIGLFFGKLQKKDQEINNLKNELKEIKKLFIESLEKINDKIRILESHDIAVILSEKLIKPLPIPPDKSEITNQKKN